MKKVPDRPRHLLDGRHFLRKKSQKMHFPVDFICDLWYSSLINFLETEPEQGHDRKYQHMFELGAAYGCADRAHRRGRRACRIFAGMPGRDGGSVPGARRRRTGAGRPGPHHAACRGVPCRVLPLRALSIRSKDFIPERRPNITYTKLPNIPRRRKP